MLRAKRRNIGRRTIAIGNRGIGGQRFERVDCFVGLRIFLSILLSFSEGNRVIFTGGGIFRFQCGGEQCERSSKYRGVKKVTGRRSG